MSTPANQGSSGNSKKTPPNKETVERFAQNMAEEIVQSLQMEIVDHWDFKRGQETMAKGLASSVIETAVREVCRGQQNATLQEQESSRDVQTSTNPVHPPLSQSGLPILGSLDYPDAPPSTPLLPELERSRQSFARKLKGGLAKEFMPSPPPPTPKENQDDPGTFEPKVELLEHLIHSLSTDQSGKDCTGVKCCQNEKIVAYAESLSCDIMKCVHQQVTDRRDVELLANQMAHAIITSSLDETKAV